MKIKVIATLTILAMVFTSCESEKATTGSLRIIFGDEKTRTIAPETTYSDTLDHYEIQLTLPSGEVYRAKNIREGSLELRSLPVGEYNLMVLGFSDDSEEYKAKGVTVFRLYANENSVTVPLIFKGIGSLELTVTFDTSKLDMTKQVDLLYEFYNENMEKIEIPITDRDIMSNGIKAILNDVPTGSYTVKIFLRSARIPIASIVEIVKIIPNTKTVGTFEMEVGDKVDSLNTIIKPLDTNMPISGNIVEKSKDSNSFTFEVDITKKPDYLKDDNIKLLWFVNGEERGNSKELKVVKADAIRGNVYIAVVISSNMEGVVGSASAIAKFGTTFAEANSGFVKD